MFISKKHCAVSFAGLVIAGILSSNCFAQPQDDNYDVNVGLKYNQKTIVNQFPCGECAVFDNNGNDLKSFINKNKNELSQKGAVISEQSGNTWGYLEIKNAKTPSVDKQGNLNYYQTFDVTLGLYPSPSGPKATWWTRECNTTKGPLVNMKVDAGTKLSMDDVKYSEMLHEMESKKVTLVEYYNDFYNPEDYDMLFKNYILMKNGTIKNTSDYKQVIDFYNVFLSKFSPVSDPALETKSFVTCFTISNVDYIGYFNIVHSKLAGNLEVADIEYDRDRDTVVNNTFKKLTGKTVYVYGDTDFGMDKAIIKYGHAHNFKLIRKKPSEFNSFNEN